MYFSIIDDMYKIPTRDCEPYAFLNHVLSHAFYS